MIVVYIIAGLIIALLLLSLTMPKSYHIEKSIVINKPVPFVMSKIGNLNDYAIWNPWQQSELSATKTITGSPNMTGHKYAWRGKKIGVGSLTLTGIDSKHIHFELEFIKPWQSKAKDDWMFDQWGDGETKVTWQNSGALPWPMARLMGPLLSKNLNRQFEEGLQNLKKMCEG